MIALLAALALLAPTDALRPRTEAEYLTLSAPATVYAPALRVDPPDPPSVEQTIRDVFPDELEERALKIAWRESRWQCCVHTWCCFGPMQIHKMHLAWLCPELNICSVDQLYDPRLNAEAAYALYLRAGRFGPWAL